MKPQDGQASEPPALPSRQRATGVGLAVRLYLYMFCPNCRFVPFVCVSC
ncbi:hypothetical protein TPAR_05799 [Tolypocladium paradoxum]|uniref:Uncharacterized protein n=1 Tax=Tolypocladium paradoxum TaxID=94208 RepID=A0A2S4KUZ8_9HYPO|nr:hypothetical protein TPAR_05799 [Tolypocladium paradoxum]